MVFQSKATYWKKISEGEKSFLSGSQTLIKNLRNVIKKSVSLYFVLSPVEINQILNHHFCNRFLAFTLKVI